MGSVGFGDGLKVRFGSLGRFWHFRAVGVGLCFRFFSGCATECKVLPRCPHIRDRALQSKMRRR